jgi:cytochrome c
MKPLAVAALLAASLSATPAFANLDLANLDLAKKLVGPSYQDIAKKHSGQKDAAVALADSIRKGGGGKWGPVPMPAQPAPSGSDVKTLAEWVLGGAT